MSQKDAKESSNSSGDADPPQKESVGETVLPAAAAPAESEARSKTPREGGGEGSEDGDDADVQTVPLVDVSTTLHKPPPASSSSAQQQTTAAAKSSSKKTATPVVEVAAKPTAEATPTAAAAAPAPAAPADEEKKKEEGKKTPTGVAAPTRAAPQTDTTVDSEAPANATQEPSAETTPIHASPPPAGAAAGDQRKEKTAVRPEAIPAVAAASSSATVSVGTPTSARMSVGAGGGVAHFAKPFSPARFEAMSPGRRPVGSTAFSNAVVENVLRANNSFMVDPAHRGAGGVGSGRGRGNHDAAPGNARSASADTAGTTATATEDGGGGTQQQQHQHHQQAPAFDHAAAMQRYTEAFGRVRQSLQRHANPAAAAAAEATGAPAAQHGTAEEQDEGDRMMGVVLRAVMEAGHMGSPTDAGECRACDAEQAGGSDSGADEAGLERGRMNSIDAVYNTSGDAQLSAGLPQQARPPLMRRETSDQLSSKHGNGNRNDDDWREDESMVIAQSSFFESTNALEVCSNRVTENILARGHPATTDAELRWLYRTTHLLTLLNKDDLDELVPLSLRREYSPGELVVDDKHPPRHVRVVVWGEVDVFRPSGGSIDSLVDRTDDDIAAAKNININNRGSQRRWKRRPHGTAADALLHYLDDDQGEDEAERDAAGGTQFLGHVATLRPGQVFGVEGCIFGRPSGFVCRSSEGVSKTILSLIPFEAIERCLARNARFSQAVGSAITGCVNVFGPIREFCRFIFAPSSSQNEYLPLWSILESYTRIQNVIHTKMFSRELDTGAWGYAIGRMPENLTTTFCFDLVHALPPFVASRMRVEARAADVRKQPTAAAASAAGNTMAVRYVRTKERRRCTWQLGMEGKTLVLLRDGFTDLLDFLTMLCVHLIESNKLRGRLQGMSHPPAIDILDEALQQLEDDRARGLQRSREEHLALVSRTLQAMPLSAEEQAGLLRNWGEATLQRMYEVMMHREEYNVRVDPSTSRKFQVNPFHEWALNLRRSVLQKLGLDRSQPLPDDLIIDVISSNTHCIKNLLGSFHRKYRAELLAFVDEPESVRRWGRRSEWHCVDDMLYVALNAFFQKPGNEALREEFIQTLEQNGITTLQDTAMTGLQVDVIPVYLLDLDSIDATVSAAVRQRYETARSQSGCCGSELSRWENVRKPLKDFRRHSSCSGGTAAAASPTSGTAGGGSSGSPASAAAACCSDGACAAFEQVRYRRHFIINMDFAFGAQAEGICRAIFSAFGQRIRSVNVMGKAGGLRGRRGDIQLATHVLLSKSSLILEDNQDELRSCRNQGLTRERLQELVGPRADVHHGKVLTVTGTMLQNVPLLRYYQRVWGCVGTEMEGSYFARVIEDFYRQGIANQDLSTRFAYYTSDLPLLQSDLEEAANRRRNHPSVGGGGGAGGNAATLSAPMTPQEGVPPLYAIARGILENIILA